MPTDLNEYKQHNLFLDKLAASAPDDMCMLIASWSHCRALSNHELISFAEGKLGKQFIEEMKSHLGDLWTHARAKSIVVDSAFNQKALKIINNNEWDHEDVVTLENDLEHASWLSLLIVGSLTLFLEALNEGKVIFVQSLMSSVDVADYVDQMEIGKSSDYPSEEMNTQRQYISSLNTGGDSTLDINSFPSSIRLS